MLTKGWKCHTMKCRTLNEKRLRPAVTAVSIQRDLNGSHLGGLFFKRREPRGKTPQKALTQQFSKTCFLWPEKVRIQIRRLWPQRWTWFQEIVSRFLILPSMKKSSGFLCLVSFFVVLFWMGPIKCLDKKSNKPSDFFVWLHEFQYWMGASMLHFFAHWFCFFTMKLLISLAFLWQFVLSAVRVCPLLDQVGSVRFLVLSPVRNLGMSLLPWFFTWPTFDHMWKQRGKEKKKNRQTQRHREEKQRIFSEKFLFAQHMQTGNRKPWNFWGHSHCGPF